MDQEFGKWLATLGVGGILAAIFYYQSRKDMKDNSVARIEDAKLYQAQLVDLHGLEKGRTDKMLDVVRENTHQTTVNTEVLRGLHRRLDRDEYERTQKEKGNGNTGRT